MRTYLWFDQDGGDAVELYASLLPDVHIGETSYYQEGAQLPAGTPLVIEFEMFGQKFAALNAGPMFTHSPAVSFQIHCDSQAELDRIWFGLIEGGGSESQCGWCVDRFGLSWQIMPTVLPQLLEHPDPDVSAKAWRAMMQMTRIDIAGLERATGVTLS